LIANRTYYVYILASRSRNLYTGMTNDLKSRVPEHKQGLVPGFTQRYQISRLVYWEAFTDVRDALGREKQIKSWRRQKKVDLISSFNPTWEDLAADWFLTEGENKQIPRCAWNDRRGGELPKITVQKRLAMSRKAK
jgi:putative endonuclease